MIPHSFYDGPGVLAAIQATAALVTVDSMIEWRHLDLEAHIFGDALKPEGGRIKVPQGPGLGIDPDPDVIRAYLRMEEFATSGDTRNAVRPRVCLCPTACPPRSNSRWLSQRGLES